MICTRIDLDMVEAQKLLAALANSGYDVDQDKWIDPMIRDMHKALSYMIGPKLGTKARLIWLLEDR